VPHTLTPDTGLLAAWVPRSCASRWTERTWSPWQAPSLSTTPRCVVVGAQGWERFGRSCRRDAGGSPILSIPESTSAFCLLSWHDATVINLVPDSPHSAIEGSWHPRWRRTSPSCTKPPRATTPRLRGPRWGGHTVLAAMLWRSSHSCASQLCVVVRFGSSEQKAA
jgi:hypothetical protein